MVFRSFLTRATQWLNSFPFLLSVLPIFSQDEAPLLFVFYTLLFFFVFRLGPFLRIGHSSVASVTLKGRADLTSGAVVSPWPPPSGETGDRSPKRRFVNFLFSVGVFLPPPRSFFRQKNSPPFVEELFSLALVVFFSPSRISLLTPKLFP